MVQIGFGGVNSAPAILVSPNPGEAVSRRVQSQQTERPVREPEESDDGGNREPDTLVDSRDRRNEKRELEAADDADLRAAQNARRREREDNELRPGDQVDLRA